MQNLPYENQTKAAAPGDRPGTLPFRLDGKLDHRIAVLGAGYAGLTCFLELQERLPKRGHDLVLINRDKYHWFTTEFHTYVAGESAENVRIPLEKVVTEPGRLELGEVRQLLPQGRVIEFTDGRKLTYDLLIFALGSDPEYFGLPGVREHSLVVGNYQGATRVRESVAKLIDRRRTARRAEPPRVVVAGGGLTGVEVASELAEAYPGDVQITLVEAGPDILAGFAPELVQTSRDVLSGMGVAIRAGNPIARVDGQTIHFKDGAEMEFDLLVWAGGVRGSGTLAASGLETTKRGRGQVDPYLHAAGHEEIYLIGDCAAWVDPETEKELPPTAQAAVQMGKQTAHNIVRRLKGKAEEPFKPNIRGVFASLGSDVGVGMMGQKQVAGAPAVFIKGLIESHHAWESGGGLLPMIGRLLRTPGMFLRSRRRLHHYRPTAAPAARPEPVRRDSPKHIAQAALMRENQSREEWHH